MMMLQQLIFCPIFRGLSFEAIQGLLVQINYQEKEFPTGAMVVQSGDECNQLYIVLSGVVRGEMLDASGKLIVIEEMYAPKPLAVGFLFGTQNRFPVNVIVSQKTKLLIIPKEGFITLMQVSQVVLTNYLNVICDKSQFLSNKIRFLSFSTIKVKLAHFIMGRVRETNNLEITIDKTQQELADFFGVTRPSLARTLKEMQEEGYISMEKKLVHVLDKHKLIQLAQSH